MALDLRQVDQLLDGTGFTPGGPATAWHWIYARWTSYWMALDSRQVDRLLDGTGFTPGGPATGWHWIHARWTSYWMALVGTYTVSVATLPSSFSMYVCIVLTTSPRHFQPKTKCNFHSSVVMVMTLPVSNALRLYPESSGGALQC